jgi:hypothetical protein
MEIVHTIPFRTEIRRSLKEWMQKGETDMEQNIVVSIFEVESEAYQAMTQLKKYPGDEKSYVPSAILVKKENGTLRLLDGFDTGANTTDDTVIGGLTGALLGILGGPIGVLLGGSYGMLVGSAFDAGDALANTSLLEQIAGKLMEGEIAIIGLAYEEEESILDSRFAGFKTIIARFDAATVAAEVEEAQKMAEEMARQARKELRDEKKAARKEKRDEKKAKLSADWAGFKAKFKKAED